MNISNIISKIHTLILIPIAIIITVLFKILHIIHFFKFITIGLIISLIPGKLGMLIRRYWYKFSLEKCGKNLFVDFGGTINYKESEIGDNVFIGLYSEIGLAKIGNDVLISSHVLIVGSKNAHGIKKDKLMRLQEGKNTKIVIGNDVWFGMNAIAFEDVNNGTIVGANSLVNKKFQEYSIIAGISARVIGKRR